MTQSRPYLLCLILLLGMLSPLAAQAATPERKKLAEQYLRVSGLETTYLNDQQLQLAWMQLLETTESTLAESVPVEQRPLLRQFLLSLVPELNVQAQESLQRMRTEMAAVLATTYSEEELRALLSFYSSPVGKKIVARNEALAVGMNAMINAHAGVLLKDMQQFVLGRLQAALQPAPAESTAAKGK